MKKKGITPIIAIIVLLLITVSLAGLAYTFLFGILVGQIEKSFIISPGGVFCDDLAGNKQITMVIRNTGTTAGIGIDDFIVKDITQPDGTIYTLNSTDFSGVITPQNITAIKTRCGGLSCQKGLNRIRLSTGASTEQRLVTCP